jgi:MFS transporter, PAT family, beta-lactamase induction signal transducer AmpG
VEGLAAHLGQMNAYAVFFLGCGALGVPALLLFWFLTRHQAAQNAALAGKTAARRG